MTKRLIFIMVMVAMGKSKLVELMSACLGDYKATVPITLITAKRNSIGSTSSEVVQLKGVTICGNARAVKRRTVLMKVL